MAIRAPDGANKFYYEDLISLDVELTRKPIYKLWLVPSKESHLGSSTYNVLVVHMLYLFL